MNQRDAQRLQHILRHCQDAASFIDRFGADYDVFIQD